MANPEELATELLAVLAYLQAAVREKAWQLRDPQSRAVEVEFDIIKQGSGRDILIEAWVDAQASGVFGHVWMISISRCGHTWEVERSITCVPVARESDELRHDLPPITFAATTELVGGLPPLIDKWLATAPPEPQPT